MSLLSGRGRKGSPERDVLEAPRRAGCRAPACSGVLGLRSLGSYGKGRAALPVDRSPVTVTLQALPPGTMVVRIQSD